MSIPNEVTLNVTINFPIKKLLKVYKRSLQDEYSLRVMTKTYDGYNKSVTFEGLMLKYKKWNLPYETSN